MTKPEFMKELESLLLDIPLEEREEALQYYYGYFEDAGEDHEDEIIKELGSPSKVASIIKADLNYNATDRESRGYFTEKGYQDTIINEEKYEIVGADKKKAESNDKTVNNSGNSGAENVNNSNWNTNNTYQKYNTNTGANYNQGTSNNQGTNFNQGANYNRGANFNQGTNYNRGANFNQGANQDAGFNQGANNRSAGQTAGNYTQQNKKTDTPLMILLLIVTSPIWFPFAMALFGIAVGIIATIFGLVLGFGAAGVAMIGAGIALFVAGLIQISVPFFGLLLCGCGLVVLGLGMLFILACVALCKNVLPAFIRGIVELCRMPFKNRSVVA